MAAVFGVAHIGVAVVGVVGVAVLVSSSDDVVVDFDDVGCTGDFNALVDVTTDPRRFMICSDYDGQIDQLRYYDTTNKLTLSAFEPRAMPSAKTVCSGICGETSLPTDCSLQNENYTRCMSELSPTSCNDPAMPAARKGAVLLYVASIGRENCF